MKARTRRARGILRDRRRYGEAARRQRYADAVYQGAYEESLVVSKIAYGIHAGHDPFQVLRDVEIVDDEEGEPCARPLTGYEQYLISKYA